MVTIPIRGLWADSKKKMTQFIRARLLLQTCKNHIYREENSGDHPLVRGQASVSVFLYNSALYLLLAFLLTLSKEGRT